MNKDKFRLHKRLLYNKGPAKNATLSFSVFQFSRICKKCFFVYLVYVSSRFMKYLISKVSRRGGNCQISAYKLLIAVYRKRGVEKAYSPFSVFSLFQY